jgi:hypothetical protein
VTGRVASLGTTSENDFDSAQGRGFLIDCPLKIKIRQSPPSTGIDKSSTLEFIDIIYLRLVNKAIVLILRARYSKLSSNPNLSSTIHYLFL